MSISRKLIELMEITKGQMSDYDQRSALGMADSYVRGGSIDTPSAKFDEVGPMNRDGLAASLIDALTGVDTNEAKEALRAARKHVNQPFASDPKIQAWRKQRDARYPKGLGMED